MSAVANTIARLTTIGDDAFARLALRVDAVVSGANGAAYLAAASALDGPLGMPASFLRPVGVFLLVYALGLWLIALLPRMRPVALRAVAAGNAGWVIGSIVLLAAGTHDPTPGGAVWVALQAGVVALFAALQVAAARRLAR